MQMLICLLFSQFISVAQSCLTLCDPMDCIMGFLSITNSWSLLRLMSIKLVMPSNHLNLCRPLLLLPSIFPNIRVFSNESVLCIRWPKNWSFSISPSNEYSELISFMIDWFDLTLSQSKLFLKSNILIYFFLNHAFGVLFMNSLSNQKSLGFSSVLFLTVL